MATDELPKCPLCGGGWRVARVVRGQWSGVHHDSDEFGDDACVFTLYRDTRAAVIAAVRRLCGEGE